MRTQLCDTEEVDFFDVDGGGMRVIHRACVPLPGQPLPEADDPSCVELLTLRGENAGVATDSGDTTLMLCGVCELVDACAVFRLERASHVFSRRCALPLLL